MRRHWMQSNPSACCARKGALIIHVRSSQQLRTMRFTGTLKTWHDERGFGFIEPTQGGQALFVHIKAFPSGTGRPQVGQVLSFEVQTARDGKKRASAVQYPAQPKRQYRSRVESPAPWTLPRLLATPALLAIFAYVAKRWGFNPVVPAIYAALSLVTLFVYAWDKEAAARRRWRTSENTLHLLALLGGWPGALLAQRWLRHKTAKPSFIAVFWLTVLLNLIGLVGWSWWRSGLTPPFGGT